MAQLSVNDRKLLIRMIEDGTPKTTVAHELNISRVTADKWYHRYQDEGPTCLEFDRSSAPNAPVRKLTPEIKRRILNLAMRHPEKGLKYYEQNL